MSNSLAKYVHSLFKMESNVDYAKFYTVRNVWVSGDIKNLVQCVSKKQDTNRLIKLCRI